MKHAPKLLVAACAFLLLACSKPAPPDAGMSSHREAKAASASTVFVSAKAAPDDPTGGSRVDCGNAQFRFAEALRELPAGMSAVLSGGAAMADQGEPFNAGDDLMYPGAPFRRFAGAALGEDRIFAAVEHGGIAYSVEYWNFLRKGSTWSGNQRWSGGVPGSLPALLSVTCLAKDEVTGSRSCPQPEYPEAAVRAKAQGTTTLALTIDEAGHVSDEKVVKTSGPSRQHRLLDRAVAESFRACTFAPAPGHDLRHTTITYSWLLD